MSRQQIEKLIKFSERQYEHGQWAKFALAEGLTKDSVFHWRKKLGLGLRFLKSANAVNVTMLVDGDRPPPQAVTMPLTLVTFCEVQETPAVPWML